MATEIGWSPGGSWTRKCNRHQPCRWVKGNGGWPRIQSNFNEKLRSTVGLIPNSQSHLLWWWVLRCWSEDQAANSANGKGEKPLIKKLFSKLEASKCWTKKSQLITLTNRTHTKGLATRTYGKSCFAKSDSHLVPQAGDWVSQGNMLLSCISRTTQHPWKLEAWKLGLLWRNDLPQVLYIFLMSGTV